MRAIETELSAVANTRVVRRSRVLLMLLGLLVLGSCSRQYNYIFQYRQLTGTCPGACEYYLSCKSNQGYEVLDPHRHQCELECREVFSTADSLRAFESLSCDNAIAFVEGPSGRMPGEPLPEASSSAQ